MARTYLIESKSDEFTKIIGDPSHTHQMHAAFERAQANGTQPDNSVVQPFHFGLVPLLRDIKTESLKHEALRNLAWMTDAWIQGALGSMLNQIYKHGKEVENVEYATYGDFLHAIESVAHSEESLYEAGCDVSPLADRIRKLFRLRGEVHTGLASMLADPTKYVIPDIREAIMNPQLRNLSVRSEEELNGIAQDDVDREARRMAKRGTHMDEDAKKALYEALVAERKVEDHFERLGDLRMAKRKATALVTLLSCLKAEAAEAVNDEDDAFNELETRIQLGLLKSSVKSVLAIRSRQVKSNALTSMEKAKLRVEASDVLEQLEDAAEACELWQDHCEQLAF